MRVATVACFIAGSLLPAGAGGQTTPHQLRQKGPKHETSNQEQEQARLHPRELIGRGGAAKQGANAFQRKNAATLPGTVTPSTSPPSDDDLGLRFSKVAWKDPSMVPSIVQRSLVAEDYPLQGYMGYWVRQSKCPSVVMEKDCFECQVPFEDLVNLVGGHPTHPSGNPESPYWTEFREVVDMQKLRLQGADPMTVMPLADTWKNMSIAAVAEAVHNEYPGFHHETLIKSLLSQGVEVDRSIIPFKCETEFLRQIVMLSDLNTWAIGTVGPPNFGVKWHVGRVRPEEVAWMIAQGNLTTDVVPVDIVESVEAMNLMQAVDFTAYPEGCPMHPSWPAMHSAASVGSLWLAVVLNLTEAQWCQAKLVDYDIAYARTVAGVHYSSDNIAGLTLGQELLATYLPGHLAARYGSNEETVRVKIDQYRFNWSEFLSSDCAKNAQQVRA
jgi:hypothetical protein